MAKKFEVKPAVTINQMVSAVMDLAKEKKFGTKPGEIDVSEKIALLHTEVSEAYEAYRKKKMSGRHGFNEELADILIRVLHLGGIFKIDLEKEILKKLKLNKSRDWDWEKLNETHS